VSSPGGGSRSNIELRDRVSPAVVEILRRSAELDFLGSMPLTDQVDHALGFVVAAESVLKGPPGAVLDLGTGGGVPGLVLLSCWPSCHLVLLDANERRTDFLAAEVARWQGAGGAEVLRGRAEDLGRDARLRDQFDLVASRSFGAPAVTAECGSPFLTVGGVMVVSEPPEGLEASRWPVEGLAEVGLQAGDRMRFEDHFGYQVLVKSKPTPERYPRRVGIPAKRPLF
jgi:16S rRNA (guanine527-N7)-methyltransferase